MKISQIKPDEVLKGMLDGNLSVQVSEDVTRIPKVYCHSKMPNVRLGDEFVVISHNGATNSLTYPPDLFSGTLAVTIWCKANSDGTAKVNRMDAIADQMWTILESSPVSDFLYRLSPYGAITPISVNSTSGYATKTLSVKWRNINY